VPASPASCQTTLIGHNGTLPEPWGVRSAANVALGKLLDLAQTPDEIELEFGVRLRT
jgi:hypothetical protein